MDVEKKMKKSLFVCLCLCFCLFVGPVSVSATPVTVTFSEESVPNLTELDNTSFFSSYGISFEDSTTFASNAMFTEDGNGIYNSSNNLLSIVWDDAISSLSFNWAIFAVDIYADAFDIHGNLVDSFSMISAAANGTGSLSGADITKVTWHDGGGTVGIDSITWELQSVPEPTSIALLGLGLAGLRLFMKKKTV